MRISATLAAASLLLGACAVVVVPEEEASSRAPGAVAAGPVVAGIVISPVMPGEELSGPAFIGIVRGNTLLAESGTGLRAILFFAADGTIRMLVWGEDGQKTRTGKMEVVDGKPCTRFADENGGMPSCFRAFKDGERIHTVKPDGTTVDATWRLVPGNPGNV